MNVVVVTGISAPDTPDIDVWMPGGLNLGYFTRQNLPDSEDRIFPDSVALMFVAENILDYPRFESALRKTMMGLPPEAFAPKQAGS